MPIASKSDIEIAQRACVMAGIPKIDTFEDASSEVAVVLNDIYEDIIADALSIHPWRFANTSIALGPPLSPPPIVEFSHRHALPNDPAPLQPRVVWLQGSIVDRWKIVGDEIHLNGSDNQTPSLEGLWRINEVFWPPWFRLYAILRVSSFLCGAITRNGNLAAALSKEADAQLSRSRTRDSQQQTTQKIRLNKIRSTRLGGRPY